MTTQATTLEVVRKSVTVVAPPERAFELFTDGIATWWPSSHLVSPSGNATALLEPREGGRYAETGEDGEFEWGRVLAVEPPSRIVYTWGLDAQYSYVPDTDRHSEIHVTFTPEGPNTTRVELEHRHFERHGDDGEQIRAVVDSPEGWAGLLEMYARAAA